MKTALLLFALALPSFGAACTSFAAGDMLTAANWASCGGGVPGNGDTVTITHAMTLAGSQTIGASLSGWAVTFNTTTDIVTCVSASCPFTAGMIVEYVRSVTFVASSVYPTGTGAGPGTRSCVDTVSGSPPQFQIKVDNCGGAVVNFGGSPSGTWYMREYTPAIQINTPGSLTVQSGGDLTIRGDVRFGNPNTARDIFVVNGGGSVEWDSSQATNPTMTSYFLPVPSATLTQGARIRFEGTAGNLATVTSNTTNSALPAARHINGTYDGTYGGDLFVDYADISCIGLSSATPSNQIVAWSNTATMSLSIKNYNFHACSGGTTVGPIGFGSTGANGVATNQYTLEDGKWLDGADGCIAYDPSSSNAPSGGGTRSIQRNYLTCRVGDSNLPQLVGLTMDYNVFVNNAPGLSCNGTWTSSVYNILINSDVNTARGMQMCGVGSGVSNTHHMILYNRVCGNVRGFLPGSGTPDNQLYEHLYAVCAQGAGVGDADLMQSPVDNGGTTASFRNNIFAPVLNAPTVGWTASGGWGTGGLTTIRDLTIENQTWAGCEGRVSQGNYTICTITLAEAANGRSDTVVGFRGILMYSEQNFSTNMMHGTGTGQGTVPNPPYDIVTNTISSAGIDYNSCYVKGGSCNNSSIYFATNTSAAAPWTGAAGVNVVNFGTKYDVPMTGVAAPGATDMDDVEPYFAGPHRTMEEWAELHGETADVTGVEDLWRDMPVADLPVEIPRVINWLFQGWQPFNVKYANSNAPQGYIGAVKPTLFFGTF